MELNWKVRFKNKVWLTGFLAAVVGFVYQILGLFDIVPPISHDQVTQVVGLVITMFASMGVLVDPTTKGVSDSDRAMAYDKPGGPSLPDDGYDWSNKATDRRGL